MGSLLVEESGKRTPESVRGYSFRDIGSGGSFFQEPTDIFGFDRIASLVGE